MPPLWGYIATIMAGGSAAIVAALPVLAQQGQDGGGLSARLGYSELLVAEDGDTSLRSDLDFALTSRTRSQSFSAILGGSFDKQASGIRLEDPRLSLSYGQETANASFDISAQYRRQELDDAFGFAPTAIPGDDPLLLDQGTRETLNVSTGMSFGDAAPFGGTLTLSYAQSNFLDATATAQSDSETLSGALRLRFDHSAKISQFVALTASDVDREIGTDVRSTSLSTGVNLIITPTLTATAELGHTRVERSGDGPRSTEDGFLVRLGLTAERPNGTVGLQFNSDLSENGRRSNLLLDRALQLPRGNLSAGIGVSQDDESSDLEPLYRLDFSHELPRARFTANLSQAFSTSTAGVEQLDSRLSLSLQQQLSTVSNFSASLNLQDSNQFGTDSVDSERVSVNLEYSQQLTQHWDLTAGVAHSRTKRSTGPEETDERIFVGLRTALEWRP